MKCNCEKNGRPKWLHDLIEEGREELRNKQPVKKEEEIKYRYYFKRGQIQSKQGWKGYNQYREDGACPVRIDDTNSLFGSKKNTPNPNIKTKTQFGVTFSC